jgi:hypothetical protein
MLHTPARIGLSEEFGHHSCVTRGVKSVLLSSDRLELFKFATRKRNPVTCYVTVA